MSFENNIKKMFAEFDGGQKDWFRFDLPDHIFEWLHGGLNGKQLSRNPQMLEDYIGHFTSHSGVQKIGVLDNLLLGLWCIRKCYGPIHAPTLYRLTKIPNLDGSNTVTIRCKESLKPVTSWTSNRNVAVLDRNPSDSDYVIQLANPQPKYVLASFQIVQQFVHIVLSNAEFFGLSLERVKRRKKLIRRSHAIDHWKETFKTLADYEQEKEYLIYLHPNESLKARIVEYVPDPYSKKKAKKKPPIGIPVQKAEPNPFLDSPGGLSKLSPREQIAMLRKEHALEKKKPMPNTMKLLSIRNTLMNMLTYARAHGISI